MKALLFPTLIVVLFSDIGKAATQFANLDFEMGSGTEGQFIVTADDGLPSWEAEIGGFKEETLGYNGFAIASRPPQIVFFEQIDNQFFPPSGRKSVWLDSGERPEFPRVVSIAQTGWVPEGSLTLEFFAWVIDDERFNVLVDDEILNLVALDKVVANGVEWLRYGADIRHFAGEEVELRFEVRPETAVELDGIEFTDRVLPVIPEPSTATYFLVGALVFLCRRKCSNTKDQVT